jgi:putative hydrolase of HD superfamily
LERKAALDRQEDDERQAVERDRLERQLEFVIEIDKLKEVLRRTILMDGSRRENSAEHSWHLAVMALTLSEYAKENDIDVLRVIKMLLIHDIVEIDAGDTYCYDDVAVGKQPAREKRAAERIFSILPSDQAEAFRNLWDEFGDGETAESRFANALDCFQPILHNYTTDGTIWKKHHIKRGQVIARNEHIRQSAPLIWKHIVRFVDDAVRKGMLLE